ncbi:MAG: hypothetical protein K6F31_10520 [Acetatifactor sp.]|nr:hypothetical protein [Acetatifactor sp.]
MNAYQAEISKKQINGKLVAAVENSKAIKTYVEGKFVAFSWGFGADC